MKHNKGRNKVEKGNVKRVQVTFTEDQWDLIEKFRGVMGSEGAEIVRNIVLAWLAEKSVVATNVKRRFSAEHGEPE
jgi:aryl-alcohol dehydrogenase-like predicted oxidoreductase